MPEPPGDHRLVAELERDYDYEGVDTCAVDGMCQVACPVEINTGDLVRRLRAERVGPVQNAVWDSAARRWAPVTKGPAPPSPWPGPCPAAAGVTRLSRRVLGHDRAPLYAAGLPRGDVARRPVVAPDAEAVFFPACIGTMFGPAADQPGVSTAFLRLWSASA